MYSVGAGISLSSDEEMWGLWRTSLPSVNRKFYFYRAVGILGRGSGPEPGQEEHVHDYLVFGHNMGIKTLNLHIQHISIDFLPVPEFLYLATILYYG